MPPPRYLDLKRYRRRLGNITRSVFEATTDRVQLIPLQRDFPQLRDYRGLARECREKLLPYYGQYTSRVSIDYMAVSLELSAFLMVLCERFRPSSILDLGSGFSSFVFRYYASKATPKPTV
ncbi:MAG: hypothetical protein Q8P59_09750, partial [Dehalococcoidia bacterium]|nr:hypothetical protein [Dehalococcoidia bacterium]